MGRCLSWIPLVTINNGLPILSSKDFQNNKTSSFSPVTLRCAGLTEDITEYESNFSFMLDVFGRLGFNYHRVLMSLYGSRCKR